MTPDDDVPPPAGTRFTVDLDALDDALDDRPLHTSAGLISDVTERTVSSSTPAVAPSLPSTSTSGFPAHTKRKRPSAFRQRVAAAATISSPSQSSGAMTGDGDGDEISAIRAQNARVVAGMSEAQVAHERQELVDSLSPELLQMFLKRASLDEPVPTSRPAPPPPPTTFTSTSTSTPPTTSTTSTTSTTGTEVPPHLSAVSDALPPTISIHFPAPPPSEQKEEEEPDPESPTFLSHLHKKYFPTLPPDPQKLAWMLPPDSKEDTYSPLQATLAPSAIRFDFRGRLLAPRAAREVPGHLGLHHHADAPLSAGYTIPELSHLARSSFPAQRCIAFQTLGRILYRLGSGAYSPSPTTNTTTPTTHTSTAAEQNGEREENGEGNREENRGSERRMASELERGLWHCIHAGRVLESLQEAAGDNGHRGSTHLGLKSYALEALWLWQKGGGERWKAD